MKNRVQFMFFAIPSLLWLTAWTAFSQGVADFRRPSSGDPLMNNNITTLCGDGLGFLWLTSDDELVKFDGMSYIYPNPEVNRKLFADDNTCLSSLATDSLIWIGTAKGLFRFNVKTHKMHEVERFRSMHVNSIVAGAGGVIYLNISGKGIFALSADTLRHNELLAFRDTPNRGNRVTSMASDSHRNLYVAIRGKVIRISSPGGVLNCDSFNKATTISIDTLLKGDFTQRLSIDRYDIIWIWNRDRLKALRLPLTEGKTLYDIGDVEISAVFHDSRGNTWLGRRGRGYVKLRRNVTGEVISHEAGSMSSQNDDLSNTPNLFFEDTRGIVWIGTKDGLFEVNDDPGHPFHNIRSYAGDHASLAHNTVSGTYVDASGTLWVATAAGLDKVTFSDIAAGKYSVSHFFDRRSSVNSIQDNKIQCIIEDGDGKLWLGTKGRLTFFDPVTNRYFERPEILPAVDSCNFIRAMQRDAAGNIAVGFESGGVVLYSRHTGVMQRLRVEGPVRPLNNCKALIFDDRGVIWAGNELCEVFRIETDSSFTKIVKADRFELNGQPEPQRGKGSVTSIFQDSYKTVWVATSAGLFRFNPDDGRFVEVVPGGGARQRYFCGITGDDSGNLWLSTPEGVCKYGVISGSFQFHELYEGNFTRKGYVFNSSYAPGGYIFMGGINGLTYFNPSEIKRDTASLRVFISNFSVRNTPVAIGSEILPLDPNYVDEVTLTHRDNNFSFDFSVLSFDRSDHIEYAYMLEGADRNWIYTGSDRRYVSYTNLPAGTYTFKVRSTNHSGVWLDNMRTMTVNILPPWWQTWWSYMIFAMLLAGLAAIGVRMWHLWSRFRTQKEINRWQRGLYANISNGLKTPLSLLQAPLDELVENFQSMKADEVAAMLKVMQRSTKRIYRLAAQLTEFRRIGTKGASLELVETDIVAFLKSIYESFCDLAAAKGIRFSFNPAIASVVLVFDPEKLEMIMFNLLSEVFRTTPEGGGVGLYCELDSADYRLRVTISGTGAGQGGNPGIMAAAPGSGALRKREESIFHSDIALSLVKDLVLLHHGQITVRDNTGGGRVFIFSLLLGNSHFSGRTIKKSEISNIRLQYADNYIETLQEPTPAIRRGVSLPDIFLVDEDAETGKFLKKMLSGDYRVTVFDSPGDVAAEMARHKPAMVITEVIFGNDLAGFDLCRHIKSESEIRHVPVMILSTMSLEEDKQNGYRSGADAYLTKPFDVKYLKMRIGMMLQSRETVKERAKMDMIINPRHVKAISSDERFLARAMEVIEKNMANESFNVDAFAASMNLSGSMLYRKIRRLTNHSPVEFLRGVRIKRAMQLFEDKAYSVTEVAMKVGFSDARYFSSCFKKEAGITPSAFIAQRSDKNPV